jgi:catechol 2,3-dioxygenase-like lactoylglutathione lyase family enzyme
LTGFKHSLRSIDLITGLTHAAVRVTDIDKSLKFYSGLLGLPEQFRLANDKGEPWLIYLKIAERQFIELFPGGAGPHEAPKCAALVHICLEVDDIQATYTELTGRGLVTRGEPKMGGDGSWQFWTDDPDGNPIEFHQFTPESRQIGPPATS